MLQILVCLSFSRRNFFRTNHPPAYNIPYPDRSSPKDDAYNFPYGGYDASLRSNGENDYEYVYDVKPNVQDGGQVNKSGGDRPAANSSKSQPRPCAFHGGNHYTKYDSSEGMAPELGESLAPRVPPNCPTSVVQRPASHGPDPGPPQYFEIDQEPQSPKNPQSCVNAHGVGAPDDSVAVSSDGNWLGHYSQ